MLSVYRRHKRDCKAGHPHELRTNEFDERKKGWKRCSCPIFASGTLGGRSRRQSTGQWEWDNAKAKAAAWDQAGAWGGENVAPPPKQDEPVNQLRISIADANRIFLASREGGHIAPATLRKYSTFTKQLTEYAASRGYVMLDQFTSADIDVFYSQWKLGPRAKGKRLGTLRAFFRFCANRKWLAENPVSPDIKPPIGANRVANKSPFTDEELQRIIEGCDKFGTVKWSNGLELNREYSGEDVKDFIWLMVYTGLRISDASLFRIDRLKGNEVFLRAKKNGGDVHTFVPDWLRDRLQSRAKLYGPRLFVVGRSDRLETVTDMWRRKIGKIFELAGSFEEPPTTHRFRHTFARILLQNGVPIADVAELMGDAEKTIKLHYSRWVREKQDRLTKILQEAFDDKPKPKLVRIR
jgi:integrase